MRNTHLMKMKTKLYSDDSKSYLGVLENLEQRRWGSPKFGGKAVEVSKKLEQKGGGQKCPDSEDRGVGKFSND